MALFLNSMEKSFFMDNKDYDKEQEQKGGSSPKPDAETLHTTDPQENMKGPVSSMIKGAGESFETNKSKDEADREKDEKL